MSIIKSLLAIFNSEPEQPPTRRRSYVRGAAVDMEDWTPPDRRPTRPSKPADSEKPKATQAPVTTSTSWEEIIELLKATAAPVHDERPNTQTVTHDDLPQTPHDQRPAMFARPALPAAARPKRPAPQSTRTPAPDETNTYLRNLDRSRKMMEEPAQGRRRNLQDVFKLLPWVRDEDEYKHFQAAQNICVFCGEQADSKDLGVSMLSNGMTFHQHCYNAVCNDLSKTTANTSEEMKRLYMSSPDQCHRLAALFYSYDYWTAYPPDWPLRRLLVLEREGHMCEECGGTNDSAGQLHIHHTVPLTEGGTNRLENLQCLCVNCHRAVHDRKIGMTERQHKKNRADKHQDKSLPKQPPAAPVQPPDNNAVEQQIRLAIDKHLDIRIKYRNANGKRSERIVTPSQLTVADSGDRCMMGYCHLKKAQCSFRLHRISKVDVVTQAASPVTDQNMGQ